MPFPSFAKTTDADVAALYAYVMKGVQPVEQANKPSEMRFPFNIRFAMTFWDFAFLDKTVFTPRPDKDAAWNRGAYIVEGLAHCGTCHTPRGFGMQEKASSDDGKFFLSGSTLSPWRSLTLRNLTSESEIAEMLKTGGTERELAFGPMTEVIHYSTQHFTDDDLHAVAHFIASLAPPGSVELPEAKLVDEKALYGSRGGLGYVQFCFLLSSARRTGRRQDHIGLGAQPLDPVERSHLGSPSRPGWRDFGANRTFASCFHHAELRNAAG